MCDFRDCVIRGMVAFLISKISCWEPAAMSKDTQEFCIGLMQRFMPVIPGLGRKKREDLELEVAWYTWQPVFITTKTNLYFEKSRLLSKSCECHLRGRTSCFSLSKPFCDLVPERTVELSEYSTTPENPCLQNLSP